MNTGGAFGLEANSVVSGPRNHFIDLFERHPQTASNGVQTKDSKLFSYRLAQSRVLI
jgi:hypothetical protein